MSTLHSGIVLARQPTPKYTQQLRFAEFELRGALPSPKTLRRWREDLGEAFVSALVAHPALWGAKDAPLRDADATQREIDRLANFVHALGPRVLVLRTPATIRPGTAALKRFLDSLKRLKTLTPHCVWDPAGVWERAEARALANDQGLLVTADPLHDRVAKERVVYARMKGLGADARYHDGRLEDLAQALAHTDEAFVVFESAGAMKEAARLQKLVDAGGLEALPPDEDFAEDDEEDGDGDDDGEFDDEDSDDEDDGA